MAAIIYFLFIGSREIKFVTIKNRFPLFHKSDPAGYENRKIEFVRPNHVCKKFRNSIVPFFSVIVYEISEKEFRK